MWKHRSIWVYTFNIKIDFLYNNFLSVWKSCKEQLDFKYLKIFLQVARS